MSGCRAVGAVTVHARRTLAVLAGGVAVVVALATPAVAAPAGLPEPGDLSLADPAGQVLVGVTLRPAAPGANQVWLRLAPPAGAPPAEELVVEAAVDGQPVALARCGPACRRGAAELTGGEQLDVRVAGEAGGTASLQLPPLPTATADALLARATARMTALDSYRIEERLGPADPPIRSRYQIAAPDRLRVVTEPGRVLVRINDRIYSRAPTERWWSSRDAPPVELPDPIWDEDDAEPVAVRLVGTDRIGGVAVDVVAFFLQVFDRPIWYRLWIDDDALVRKAEMLTAGHFMQHRYDAFNEPVTVDAPYGPLGRAAVARFGDPPQAYWQAGAAAARWAAFVGVLGAAGAAAFVAIVHDRRPGELRPLGREVTVAAVAAMVATLIEAGLGTAAEGGGLVGLGDADAWRATVGGATAASLLVRAVGLAGLLGALPRLWSPPAVRLAVVAGGVALASLLPTGHSTTADPPWLALTVDYAHVVAAAGWFGGLAMLTRTLGRRRDADAPTATGMIVVFSRAALAGVAVLVVAGLALAAIHTGALSAIVDTAYGRTLALKTVLVAGVIAAAASNRLRLVPAIQAGDDRAWLWLRRTATVEVAGLIAVLAVTAVLVHVRPPT